jgi:hypothetical protein
MRGVTQPKNEFEQAILIASRVLENEDCPDPELVILARQFFKAIRWAAQTIPKGVAAEHADIEVSSR